MVNYRDVKGPPVVNKDLSTYVNDCGFVTGTDVEGMMVTTMANMPGQQPSDWNATSGPTRIINKPTEFNPTSHTHNISSVVGLQVALDGKLTIGTPIPYALLTGTPFIPAAQVNSDWSAVSGVSQVLNKPTIPAAQVNSDWTASSGVASILNKPVLRRVETYNGVTNASGLYTVTYSTPFSTVPDVQPQLFGGPPTYVARVTDSTVNGFTITVTTRNSATLLGLEILLAATTVVNGAPVGVLVTSR